MCKLGEVLRTAHHHGRGVPRQNRTHGANTGTGREHAFLLSARNGEDQEDVLESGGLAILLLLPPMAETGFGERNGDLCFAAHRCDTSAQYDRFSGTWPVMENQWPQICVGTYWRTDRYSSELSMEK